MRRDRTNRREPKKYWTQINKVHVRHLRLEKPETQARRTLATRGGVHNNETLLGWLCGLFVRLDSGVEHNARAAWLQKTKSKRGTQLSGRGKAVLQGMLANTVPSIAWALFALIPFSLSTCWWSMWFILEGRGCNHRCFPEGVRGVCIHSLQDREYSMENISRRLFYCRSLCITFLGETA